ncbi:hypothetical protein D3C86_1488590 [compost metagenome]
MPSRCACAFICATKLSLVPPMVSAIATAMSLADLMSSSFKALSIVSFWPGLKYIFEAGWSAAFLLITTSVCGLILPAFICEKAI